MPSLHGIFRTCLELSQRAWTLGRNFRPTKCITLRSAIFTSSVDVADLQTRRTPAILQTNLTGGVLICHGAAFFADPEPMDRPGFDLKIEAGIGEILPAADEIRWCICSYRCRQQDIGHQRGEIK